MDDVVLLELAYRTRPATIAELTALSRLDEHELAPPIARLEASGALIVHDGRIEYPHPSTWAEKAVRQEVDRLRHESAETLTQIESIVGRLPRMLRHWSAGETHGDLLPVQAWHGPRAAEDLWYSVTRHDHGRAEAVFPDVSRFLQSDPARTARFAEAFRRKDAVRAILPADVMADPELAARVSGFAAAGVDFRLLAAPPSWFWIDDETLALPFRWGEGWPSSVLGVRSPALTELARAYFEVLWRRAQPIVAAERPWTPLLRLMRQGVTLDAASRSLGINPRTGRRRVAAAMEHYGVSTLFALGTAWSAERENATVGRVR